MKRYFSFVLLVTILLTLILIWFGVIRLHEFKSYHQSIASSTTAGVSSEIARFVSEKKRLMAVFTNEHRDLIHRLITHPHDVAIEKEMSRKLRDYFPSYFTFTVTDNRGAPLLTDFDGLIGNQCLHDIQAFAQTNVQQPIVHPHSERYHFDIMNHISNRGFSGILFVSFDANLLGKILRNAQVPGHQTLLVTKDMLLEASAYGARNQAFRDDYHLRSDETRRILNSQDISGTSWRVIDLYNPRLFGSYRNQIIQQSLVIVLGYLALLLMMYARVHHMEKLRRQAEQHKNEFLSIVSHELRTPLTSIHGALSLILNGKLGEIDDKTRDFIRIALNNSERLSYLVDDLLDVQRIESGMMEFNMSPVDLVAMVKSCIESQQEFAHKYYSTIQLCSDIDNIKVFVDKQRMSQAIINLLSNAVKYGADKDEVQVHIERSGTHARIIIVNHGTPIDENDRKRIFEKFIQLDASATRRVGGTGLGLNIVKQIVEKHHGFVDYLSNEESTRFFIELPIY